MSSIAMPTIWVFEVPNQLRNCGRAQVWFEISFVGRVFRGDAIDPAHCVATPEIHSSFDGIGDCARSLNEFTVDVYNVQITVGCIGEVARTKPGIGGGHEFPLLLFGSAARKKADSIRRQDIAMNQASTHLSSKQIAAVFLGELIAGIDRATAGSGKVPPSHLGRRIQW